MPKKTGSPHHASALCDDLSASFDESSLALRAAVSLLSVCALGLCSALALAELAKRAGEEGLITTTVFRTWVLRLDPIPPHVVTQLMCEQLENQTAFDAMFGSDLDVLTCKMATGGWQFLQELRKPPGNSPCHVVGPSPDYGKDVHPVLMWFLQRGTPDPCDFNAVLAFVFRKYPVDTMNYSLPRLLQDTGYKWPSTSCRWFAFASRFSN